MKVVGIITEYNPFHNGHKYHIQKAKEITNSDFCICVMSGTFTQQGNISLIDKFKKAKIACQNGCDLVIELPTIYASSSAENFALGSVNILDKLNVVDTICFGSETANIQSLTKISDIILKNEDKIWNITKEKLNKGKNFTDARYEALSTFLDEDMMNEISTSNNILGLEYINAKKRLNSNIEFTSIKRNSSNFLDRTLSTNTPFTSSTSIREYLKNNKISNIKDLKNYLPNDSYTLLSNSKITLNDDLYQILKYKIINSTTEDLAKIYEVNEGLEYKIKNELNNSNDYYEFVNNIKSRRYKLSKIKRMLNNILIDLTKNDSKNAISKNIAYAHVLACSKNGKKLLSQISKNSSIPVFTKLNDTILNSLDNDIKNVLSYDIKASDLHSILLNSKIKKDYTNHL